MWGNESPHIPSPSSLAMSHCHLGLFTRSLATARGKVWLTSSGSSLGLTTRPWSAASSLQIVTRGYMASHSCNLQLEICIIQCFGGPSAVMWFSFHSAQQSVWSLGFAVGEPLRRSKALYILWLNLLATSQTMYIVWFNLLHAPQTLYILCLRGLTCYTPPKLCVTLCVKTILHLQLLIYTLRIIMYLTFHFFITPVKVWCAQLFCKYVYYTVLIIILAHNAVSPPPCMSFQFSNTQCVK